MAANPYSGLTLAQLQAQQTYLLGVLSGQTMEQFGGQGSNFKRKLPSLAEARQDFQLVNAAIAALDPNAPPQVTRTIGSHWHDFTR